MDALWGWVPGLKKNEQVDYLADERIDLVNYGQLKVFLKAKGVKPNDMQYASTKYALIAYAEKFKVDLEPLLEQADRAAFPEKYSQRDAPPPPSSTGGIAQTPQRTFPAPTGVSARSAAKESTPRAVAATPAPPPPPVALEPAEPKELTVTEKVDAIKAKLSIPADVDFPAERMAATVPIEGTVEDKISALYIKLCIEPISSQDVDHLKGAATAIQSRFRGHQTRSHMPTPSSAPASKGDGAAEATPESAAPEPAAPKPTTEPTAETASQAAPAPEPGAEALPTLDSLSTEQLAALVNAIVVREEVLEMGESKEFVLDKANEYLSHMGVQGDVKTRSAELEKIINEALGLVVQAEEQSAPRYNELRESPADAKYKLCVVQFKVPGAKNGGSDKGPDGNRIDSIPIANGVIAAGGACDLILYDAEKHDDFVAETAKYDALIVRINPGQLSQGTPDGTQARFDELMNSYIAQGKLVWSSPKIQTQMGAKDALVKIGRLGCGLPDTLAYYDGDALEKGFKGCCAYQPRVIKQNRGSAGEGIWLCWLAKKEDNSLVPFSEYPAKSLKASEDGLTVETDASLGDDDWLKLMEMNDNHVEYHTVKEFLVFCVGGPEAEGAGEWKSTFPGKYLEGGKEAGGQLVDQRLLPRIEEGEVRILMAGDTCQMAIHKKPQGGGLSAVGGNSDYTYYTPEDAKYKGMIETLYKDIPTLLPCMGLEGEPLPLLWTCDYIPKNPEGWDKAENATDEETEYVVGEFNCSCVGISMFQAVCGGEKTLADVPDDDYHEACKLTDLMGVKAIEMLQKARPKPYWGLPRYNELRPSPKRAKYKLCVVQFKVPGAKNGGSDKGPDGNRIDSIPIANGVIAAGGACDLILYDAEKHDDFVAETAKYDALIVRINPGQLSQGTPDGTQARFDELMNSYIAQGKLVWSSPKIQTQMGAKDALVKIGRLGCGLPDTLAYYDGDALEKGFKGCCAYQPRVIKQNRGSAGEGIWLCWLAKKEDNSLVPFSEYPAKSLKASEDGLTVETDASLGDDDWLKLMEMNDNHVEYHTVKEFLVFCVGGPEAEGAGEWKSTFPGKYLEGGKEAGGQLVDQRLLPRIEEGEVRILMAGDTCQMAIHKKPQGGGLSAVGGNSDYTYYTPEDAKYKGMIETLYKDIPTLLPCMGLEGEPLPLLWTCDYIPKNPEGWDKAENATDEETEYVVGEFNCSCVGISMFQAVCGGEKTLADVPDDDYHEACKLTDLMGVKAIEMLQVANPKPDPVRYNELRESPADAKYKLCVVQFKVPGAKNGGSDKGPDGNRIDSIPIANGVIAAGGACDLILYDAEKHDDFVAETAKYDALIVRINPGQLSQGTPDGTQARFDELMNSYIAQGKLVWSSPKIQTQMGAKDALVKIGRLGCGLPDTLAYYDGDALEKGFKGCCAYQPRVIKQNRGSAGEGIWLCWLAKKEDNSLVPFSEYPAKSLKASEDGLTVETDASLGDDDWLKLMEMNDNHVEYHTVKEFLVFCVGGPEAEGAGEWKSTFPGKYLEGGKEAGGQLVDQRLLPRIEEGEVRILMAGDTCQMAIHKKPQGGGLSAVGGNSDYTYYTPEDAKYKGMIETLYKDIPTLLPCMGLEGEPLPLLWTCDYIPKNPEGWDKAENATDEETEYVVGEFNCSCVGISMFQAVCGGEKTLADVPDDDYFDACQLTDLMGVKAIEMLEKAAASKAEPVS